MGLRFIAISVILLSATISLAEQDMASYYHEKGLENLNNKSYERAIQFFDRSIAEDPAYWDAWLSKGEALFYSENYNDGLALCDEVLSNSKGPQGEKSAPFRMLDGSFSKAYEDKYGVPPITTLGTGASSGKMPERYQLALESYDEALKLNPNLTSAWNGKGILFGDTGRFDESINCFERVLSIDSSLAEVMNNKGVSLDRQGRHEESLACYDRAIELNPKLAQAWMNRARTLSLDMSLFAWAKQNASHAIELDPSLDNEESWMSWGYIHVF